MDDRTHKITYYFKDGSKKEINHLSSYETTNLLFGFRNMSPNGTQTITGDDGTVIIVRANVNYVEVK